MRYKNPAATVDLIVEEAGEILLIKRKRNPFRGYWALPGGFLNCGKENLEQAGIRELKEETRLRARTRDLRLIGVYSDPGRDPRGHIISHAYHVTRYRGKPRAADDAKEYAWFDLDALPRLAFDHKKIISDYKSWRKQNVQ